MSLSPSALGTSAPTILLAEDSEDDFFFFQRAFRKACADCFLLRAGNGKIAIEMLSGSAKQAGYSQAHGFPKLVFLDLKMPVMSGFEVLEWLRSSPIHPKPKVIVLSGSNDHSDKLRALSLGAVEYLVKPITAEDLRKRVEAEVQGAQNASANPGAAP